MPAIGIRISKRPRWHRRCESCGMMIEMGETHVRLFGYAERGDPPTCLWVHAAAACCGSEWPRVEVALAAEEE